MGLIDFEMQGVTFNYRCEDYDIISKQDQVTICYTLDDMSQVHLYEISDKPLKKYLGAAIEIPSIVPYGPDAFHGYGKQQAIIKQLSDFREQELEFKMAVGYDSMAILNSGNTPKAVYEAADAQATFKETFGISKEEDADGYDASNQYS
jgi:hypothetical protein